MAFGSRLRAERERRTITLASIAANTNIGIGLLRGLEKGDVSRWPGGIFRRSFIRAYAEAIGLDPDDVLREFLERFPDPEGPAPGAAAHPGPAHVLRLTLAEPPRPFTGGSPLAARRRVAAAAADGALMLLIAGAVYAISGEAGGAMGAGVTAGFLGSILALGNTPGVWLVVRSGATASPAEDAPRRYGRIFEAAGDSSYELPAIREISSSA